MTLILLVAQLHLVADILHLQFILPFLLKIAKQATLAILIMYFHQMYLVLAIVSLIFVYVIYKVSVQIQLHLRAQQLPFLAYLFHPICQVHPTKTKL